MDFKDFKKVGVTRTHTIFEHPEGHTIHINHAGLKPGLKKEMREIPVQKLAEGGQVSPEDQNQALYGDSGQGMWEGIRNFLGTQIGAPGPSREDVAKYGSVDAATAAQRLGKASESPEQQQFHQEQQQDNAPPQQSAPQNFPMPQMQQASMSQGMDPYGTQAYMGAMQQGIQQQKQGILQEAKAKGQQGSEEQKLLSNSQEQLNHLQEDYTRHHDELVAERNSLINDITNTHVDPQRFLGKMDTNQKVMTAIGLVLGGIGSGMQGGENPVLKMLNQQIDRDIDAQRVDLDKKHTLLSANMQSMGDLRSATDMTRLNMLDMLKAGLQGAAAKAQSPLAKANALQAIGQIDQQTAPIMSQLAARRALLQGAQNGKVAPEMVIRFTVPENRQKEATEALQSAQEMKQAGDHALQAFDQLDHSFLAGKLTPGRREALIQPVIAALAKASAGRFTEMEGKAFTNIFPSPADSNETRRVKRENMVNLLTQKMKFPILTEYGIPIPGVSATRPNNNVPVGYKR